MITKKDRKIANLTQMITNRDKLINDFEERREFYKSQILTKDEIIREHQIIINQIHELATSNKYSNEKAILGKIIELSVTAKSIR